MTPDYPLSYQTGEFVEYLSELLANAQTKRVLEILWYTIPVTSPGYGRVMNLRAQYLESERRELDGQGGWKKDRRRTLPAVKSVLDDLLIEYPYSIPLRQNPLTVGDYGVLGLPVDYEEEPAYELEESAYRERSSSSAGFLMLLGALILCGVVFVLAKTSGEGYAEGTPNTAFEAPKVGWVLHLTDGSDCEKLEQQYYYVFNHHEGAAVVQTKRGGCSLVIKFPDKASAEARLRRTKSLKRSFPGLRVLEL